MNTLDRQALEHARQQTEIERHGRIRAARRAANRNAPSYRREWTENPDGDNLTLPITREDRLYDPDWATATLPATPPPTTRTGTGACPWMTSATRSTGASRGAGS